jgi:hypothetical protein
MIKKWHSWVDDRLVLYLYKHRKLLSRIRNRTDCVKHQTLSHSTRRCSFAPQYQPIRAQARKMVLHWASFGRFLSRLATKCMRILSRPESRLRLIEAVSWDELNTVILQKFWSKGFGLEKWYPTISRPSKLSKPGIAAALQSQHHISKKLLLIPALLTRGHLHEPEW